jgi:predicted 2-oxoglutarate/Fe(II)-dependent dioxygenase YbiX
LPILSLSALKDGMILSNDAVDAAGAIVLPEGTILDTASLARLREAGVTRAAVKGRTTLRRRIAKARAQSAAGKPNEKPDHADAAVEDRLMRLAAMFARHRDDPLMRELLRIAILCAREGLVRG